MWFKKKLLKPSHVQIYFLDKCYNYFALHSEISKSVKARYKATTKIVMPF